MFFSSLSSSSEFASTIPKTLLLLFISVLLFTPAEPAAASSSSTAKLQELSVELEAPWPLIDDENVVAMTEKSYTDYMDEKKGVVLLFYDSNCPTCRKLAPEYAAAAEMLQGDEVVFGMVDAYESARGFFIIRYPTMCSLFPNGRLSYYNFEESEAKRDAIITWVKRTITPVIYSITKMEDAERIFNEETHLVLGFFEDLEGLETRELAAVQQLHSGNLNFYKLQGLMLQSFSTSTHKFNALL